jgi:tRNA nucleotidyltransferase (CCA-adding enzyme)
MRDIVAAGELAELTPERVWQELARGLMTRRPSRMFAVLRECGALKVILSEVDALFGIPQPVQHHPEIDTGVHVMQAIDYAAQHDFALPVRYAVLMHDLGKATTAPEILPRHHGHEGRSVALAQSISERLKVPATCADLAVLVAREHGKVHRSLELKSTTLLDLLRAADAWRRPERLEGLLQACRCDVLSRPGRSEPYVPEAYLRSALRAAAAVDAGTIALACERPELIPQRIRDAQVQALEHWKKEQSARNG